MSYQSCLGHLQACIGSATGFGGTAKVEIADYKIFTYGYGTVALLEINPRIRHIRETFAGGHVHEWHTTVQVGARWADAENGPFDMTAAWQSVFDQLDTHPQLGLGGGNAAGIRDVFIESANLQPLEQLYGEHKYQTVSLSVVIQEEVDVVEAE